MEALKPGDPGVVGRYRLSARLAQGRLGAVFVGKAKDGCPVAVRLVRPDLASDTKFVERFRKTIAAIREVDGPHLAHILDADADAKWLVSEYAPGLPLDAAVREHGALPEESVRALGSALARALAALHAAKVVHQGLSASTVVLTKDGPQITDLGLPALLGADAATTLPAPEQATGGTLSGATDVFALAGLLCHAAGVHPYGKGTGPQLAQKVLRTEADLGELPEELAGPLARCFARKPDARPTATELVELFDGADASGLAWLPESVREAVDAAASTPMPKGREKAAQASKPAQAGAAPKAESPKPASASNGKSSPAPAKAPAPRSAPDDDATVAVDETASEAAPEAPAAPATPAAPTVLVRKAESDKPGPAPAREPVSTAATVEAPQRPAAEPRQDGEVPVAAAATVLAPKLPPPPGRPAEPGSEVTVEAPREGVAARAAEAASAAETVLAGKPLDSPRLIKPRVGEAAEPAESAAAAAPAAPRWSPIDGAGRAPEAPAEPAAQPAARPVVQPVEQPVERPVAFPQAPPVEAAGHAAAWQAAAQEAGRQQAAPAKREASSTVWYAVIVLVGLTSAGLAVYRLLDSEWRDLQNPFMGLVLPGVSLVFGLAGIVVLALAVAKRRKSPHQSV